MLALSSRAGELAERIGPRLPMTVGPALSAVGTLLLLRIDEDASYVADVLPGVALFGLGLAATVAPLTTTVLAAAPDRHAGLASGVNNAVARTAGLLAVAALPVVVGLNAAYGDPAAEIAAFHRAAAGLRRPAAGRQRRGGGAGPSTRARRPRPAPRALPVPPPLRRRGPALAARRRPPLPRDLAATARPSRGSARRPWPTPAPLGRPPPATELNPAWIGQLQPAQGRFSTSTTGTSPAGVNPKTWP